MDSKNVLLVVASVSLFLVIILAAGMWLFWPQGDREEAAVTMEPLFSEPQPFDTFEYYRGRQELPGLVEKPEDAPLTITVGEAEQTPPTTAVAVTPRDETPKPRAVPTPVSKPRTPVAKPVSAVRPTPTSTPTRTRVSEYWIQAGSYKSRTRAETLNTRLTGHGIAGTIQTRDIRGDLWFRVRVGPYANQAEAEKFLDSLKTIDGLEQSYISQVTRIKS